MRGHSPRHRGDQLPFHWRELKQLQRRHLAIFGLSEDACNPRVREGFAELVEQSLLVNGLPLLRRIRWYPPPWFPVASRSISAAISVLTGGRPARFG
jgi:hypothetical protein